MSRKLFLCLSIVLLVGLCACASKNVNIDAGELSNEKVNDFAGASMEVKDGTVTPKGLTLEIKSTNKNECIYGHEYSLEVYKGEQWYLLNDIVDGRVVWTKIGYPVYNGETSECSVDWTSFYGELGEGHYRIVKSIMDFRGSGDFDQYYLAAEFTIVSN